MKTRISGILVALTAVTLGMTVSHAQQAASAANSAADATNGASNTGAAPVALQEVIVTAERRVETEQNAPVAVSALSGDAIANANVTSAENLTHLMPSLQFGEIDGPYDTFFLRGVGNFAGTALTEPSVITNFDGVAVTRSGTSGMFYDLSRVEVLEGPQGTLYGLNATGGVVNVISNPPVLNQWGGNATVTGGNYSTFQGEGALNIPVGTDAALRIAGQRVTHDGYMDDGTDDQDDNSGRISFLYKPNDSLNVSIVGDYFHQGGNELEGGTVIGENAAFVPGPGFTEADRVGPYSPQMAAYLATQPNTISGRTFGPFGPPSYNDNRYWGLESTINWTTPIGTLTLIPALRRTGLGYISYGSGVQIHEITDEAQKSFEARLASDTQRALSYLVGLYYMDDTVQEPSFDVNQQSNFTAESFHSDATNRAVYGDLTYKFADTWRVIGGVRYTRQTADFTGVSTADTIVCTLGFLACPDAPTIPYDNFTPVPPNYNPYAPGAGGTQTFLSSFSNGPEYKAWTNVTWRAAVQKDLTPENMLYGSVNTGFRAGGFSFSTSPATESFQPETITAYTIGSKNRFLDERLQANVEVFYYDYHNQQLAHLDYSPNPEDPEDLFTIYPTTNVGHSTYKGVEVNLKARPVRETLLSLDVQYEDGSYDNFEYQTPNSNGGLGNGTGCPSSAVSAEYYTVDCSGFRPYMTPMWTATVGMQQTIPLASGALVGDVQGHYQSAEYTGDYFLPAQWEGGYGTWDFDLTYYTPSRHYFVGAYVDNAFDKVANDFSFDVPFSEFTWGLLIPPRTYGMRLGASF